MDMLAKANITNELVDIPFADHSFDTSVSDLATQIAEQAEIYLKMSYFKGKLKGLSHGIPCRAYTVGSSLGLPMKKLDTVPVLQGC